MNRLPAIAVSAALVLLTGCTTFETLTPDAIRSREEVLFEGTANLGQISADGDRITWQGRRAILATPTTLYCGAEPLSFATIDSIEVGGFQEAGFIPFQPPQTYSDLLTVKEGRGAFGRGCVLQMVPNETTSRRAQAEQLAALLEALRGAVDPFGRLDDPRRVWLAMGLARAPSIWSREPHFLEEHYPVERRALEKLFRDASSAVAQRFTESFWRALPSISGSYAFEPLPDLAITRRGWLDPVSVKKAIAGREPVLNRLLVADLTRFDLAEKIDPQRNPSVAVTFRFYVDYYNLAPPQNGAAHWHERVVIAPLAEWLAGGTDGILAEVDRTGIAAAAQLQRQLAPFSPSLSGG